MDRNDAVLRSSDTLMAALLTTFEETDKENTAISRMNALRQGSNSVEEFSGKFLDITSNIDWADGPLINAYYLGLAPRIKKEMGSRDPPANLAEAITLATRAEHRVTLRT
jgi:retrotransposon gag protein